MAERKRGLEKKEPRKTDEERRDEILQDDPDREPPRTAKPPNDETEEWQRDEGC